MVTIDTSAPVLVTGATGYVAGWIVKRLLEAGVTVHAPVRNPDDAEKRAALDAIAAAAPGTIRYFEADLLTEGSYGEAMQGCTVVFHTASPFTSSVKDPQSELIDPALNGTKNVLAEVDRTDSVHRVVLTSSCAAIYTDAIDTQNAPGGRITEDVWNTTASLDYQPYSLSKTLAERAAWEIARAQSRWDMVALNPCLVMGPAIGGKPTSESFNIMRQAGGGAFKRGAPRMGLGIVDVRDLADAHIAAAFSPEANGRNIVCGHETDILSAVMLLQDRFAAYPLPTKPMPKWLLWLIGPMVGLPRKTITGSVDVPWTADNSKGLRELGLTYRPLRDTMEEMFAYMINAGYFPKP